MERYTLKEISALIDMPESSLGKFLDSEEKKQFFGGEGRPPLYPGEAIALFQALKQLRDEKVVKPQNFFELRHLITSRSGENPKPDLGRGTLAISESQNLFSDFGPDDLQQILERAFTAALRAERAQHGAPQTDTPLTRQEAAALLHCHPSSVSRHVEPLRRGVYSTLMVQRKLTEWREAAEARQAARASAPKRIRAPRSVPAIAPPEEPQ